MNSTRIISIAVLLIAIFVLALVISKDSSTLERVVIVLLPTMSAMLGLLIGEEIRENMHDKK